MCFRAAGFNNPNGNPNPPGTLPTGIQRAAKVSQLFSDNALFWDTPTFSNLASLGRTTMIPSYQVSFIDNDGGSRGR